MSAACLTRVVLSWAKLCEIHIANPRSPDFRMCGTAAQVENLKFTQRTRPKGCGGSVEHILLQQIRDAECIRMLGCGLRASSSFPMALMTGRSTVASPALADDLRGERFIESLARRAALRLAVQFGTLEETRSKVTDPATLQMTPTHFHPYQLRQTVITLRSLWLVNTPRRLRHHVVSLQFVFIYNSYSASAKIPVRSREPSVSRPCPVWVVDVGNGF